MPWVNQKVKAEIEKRNLLLRRWRNNKKNKNLYEEYKKQRNVTTNIIKKEKRIFIHKQFLDTEGDMLKTWRMINELMDRKIKVPIESTLKRNFKTDDLTALSNQFNFNFINQVKEIKAKNAGPMPDVQYEDHELPNIFQHVTQEYHGERNLWYHKKHEENRSRIGWYKKW